jgi:hypothetical protein
LRKLASNYSEAIDILCDQIRSMGFSLSVLCAGDGTDGGSTDYQLKQVTINHPSAKLAMVILAHEAGHCLHYLEDNDLESSCSRTLREAHALARGWKLLQDLEVGVDLITAAEWFEIGASDEPQPGRVILPTFSQSFDVFVNWDYALTVCAQLDRPEAGEDRLPMRGKAAISILAEYGATAHRCCHPPAGTKLAIVISPPSIWFCPSQFGLDGVWIDSYSEREFGQGVELALTTPNLWRFDNIHARLDAWDFVAEILGRDRINDAQRIIQQYKA